MKRFCAPPVPKCNTWDLTTNNDVGNIDRYGAEAINIAGAVINVFKLLGLHEQNKTMDVTGNGKPVTSDTLSGSNPREMFIKNSCTPWRSRDRGECVIANSFIGYDFGVQKLENGRDRYGVPAPVRYVVSTLKIKQSNDPLKRVTKARIERSDDGVKWFGVAIVDLPDNSELNTVSFKVTTLARMWRVRPVQFNGHADEAFWEVYTLELSEHDATMLDSIQDEFGWLENRDREYDINPIKVKGFYDLLEKESDLTPYGFSFTGSQFYIVANFNDLVTKIGRPIVIGDILELPSEAQYNVKLDKVLKYLEVIDVSWSAEGYAPGWQPTMVRIIAEPMLAKQETMDIIGDMAGSVDSSGLFNIDTSKYSNIAHVSSERIQQKAKSELPQDGIDTSALYAPEQEVVEQYAKYGIDVQKLGINQTALYVEDGLPKDGSPYTEGTEFPLNPTDKAYHRMTYVGMAQDVPPRLYRYSAAKGRWVHLESDKRQQFNGNKPGLDKLLQSKQAIPARTLGKRK